MEKLRILFLCTGNSCRSQMAEGWTRHLKGDQIEVWSAGVEVHGLDPLAVKVMAEAGVNISNHHSKSVKDVFDIPFDAVITVCDHARESCPNFPRPVRKIHENFDDPPFLAKSAKSETEVLNIYRRVRDEIRTFVETLSQSLQEQS
jgi:arsenate reductase